MALQARSALWSGHLLARNPLATRLQTPYLKFGSVQLRLGADAVPFAGPPAEPAGAARRRLSRCRRVWAPRGSNHKRWAVARFIYRFGSGEGPSGGAAVGMKLTCLESCQPLGT